LNHLDLLQLLAAILRGDAEALAAAPLDEEATLGALAWVASEQLLSPALYPSLVRRGQLGSFPEEFASYLRSLHELNGQRNERILAQAGEIHDALSTVGIRPLALKGLAGLVSRLYPEPAERLIADIDVQVPEDRMELARGAVVQLGYRLTPAPGATEDGYDDTHQDAPLIHPARGAAVELHRRWLLSRSANRLIEALDSAPEGEVTCVGRSWRVPSPTSWLAHIWLHQMVQDGAYSRGRFHLRQLLDVRRLVERDRSRIDFERLEHAVHEAGYIGEWGALGVALARLLGTEIPIASRARALGELWYQRARIQCRWPSIEPWLRHQYMQMQRLLPGRFRDKLLWSRRGRESD
jgi:hypothetical protein